MTKSYLSQVQYLSNAILCLSFPTTVLFLQKVSSRQQSTVHIFSGPPAPRPDATPSRQFLNICQVLSRWDVGWILFCCSAVSCCVPSNWTYGSQSTTEKYIAPECNIQNEVQKEKYFHLFAPCFCLFHFPSDVSITSIVTPHRSL